MTLIIPRFDLIAKSSTTEQFISVDGAVGVGYLMLPCPFSKYEYGRLMAGDGDPHEIAEMGPAVMAR